MCSFGLVESMVFHPCRDVCQAAWDPCSYRWIIWSKWEIELCVISVEMVGETMCLYDGTQWCSVCGEEEGSKNRALRNISVQLMCFGYFPASLTLLHLYTTSHWCKNTSRRHAIPLLILRRDLLWSAENTADLMHCLVWCRSARFPWNTEQQSLKNPCLTGKAEVSPFCWLENRDSLDGC